jgi:hypothetical protein
VPLVRGLHPEFGYLGSFHLFGRKFGLLLVFIGFGVMAGMSGLAVFMADEQPDPMQAMALAPPDTVSRDPGLVLPVPVDASVPIVPAQKPVETNTSLFSEFTYQLQHAAIAANGRVDAAAGSRGKPIEQESLFDRLLVTKPPTEAGLRGIGLRWNRARNQAAFGDQCGLRP